jgi:hypothetical protein
MPITQGQAMIALKSLAYLALYPIRYTLSGIGFVIVGTFALLNLALCGDMDNTKGLIGMLTDGIATGLSFLNLKMIGFHKSLKPIAWSRKKAITLFRETMRWYTSEIADGHRQREVERVLASDTAKGDKIGIRFWTSALKRGKARRRAEAIAWNLKCDEYEKNPREGYTMTRSVVEPLEA